MKEHFHSGEGKMYKLFKQTNFSSDQALYSKETKLRLTNSLPSDPSSQVQLVTSVSLTTSLSFTVTARPRCEQGFLAVPKKPFWQQHSSYQAPCTTQLLGLMHFLAQHIRATWQLKATLASSQSSRKREIFSPDWSCPR